MKTIDRPIENKNSSYDLGDIFSSNHIFAPEELFDSRVREVLDRYEVGPELFSPKEEIIILNRLSQGLMFEMPGIADQDGIYEVADQIRRISRDLDFKFTSELGRRYAKYCDKADTLATLESESSSESTKFLIGYGADTLETEAQSAWLADMSKYIYAKDELSGDNTEDAEYKKVLNSPNFQSFLAHEFQYVKKDFGDNFPIGLFVDYISGKSPEEYRRTFQALEKLPKEVRGLVAESFMTIEFGDDLGEQVLQLAERHSDSPQLLDAMNSISGIIKSSANFTTKGLFAEVDRVWADDMRRGVSARTSELLFSINQRLGRGKNIDNPVEAINKLHEWSKGVDSMLSYGVPVKVQQTGDTYLFHFINPETGDKFPGALELTSYGKSKESATPREVYVKEGRGARASMTYDEELVEQALSIDGSERRQAMNCRFDKSTFNVVTGKVEPDADHAEVSFDIASQHAQGVSKLIFQMISEARQIREGRTHSDNGQKLGAYTYEIVDQRFGDRDTFASNIQKTANILEGRSREYGGQRLASAIGSKALTHELAA